MKTQTRAFNGKKSSESHYAVKLKEMAGENEQLFVLNNITQGNEIWKGIRKQVQEPRG